MKWKVLRDAIHGQTQILPLITFQNFLFLNTNMAFTNFKLCNFTGKTPNHIMKKIALASCFFFLFCLVTSAQERTNSSSVVTLPNGWSLSPAGHGFLLGDLPLNIAVSNSKNLMAVTNNGQSTQSIQLIDVPTEKIVDNIVVKECWLGLKFSADEKFLYASGGNDNWILKYAIKNKKLLLQDSLKLGEKWPNEISPAGIDIDDKKNLLYVVTKAVSYTHLTLPTKRIV